MPRRIEIEMTSHADNVWTWRAAGAKLPKGSLASGTVPEGTAVGDVLRAEVESGIDGLEIVSVSAKAGKGDDAPANRIEVLRTPQRESSVSVIYAPGARRRRDDGDRPPRREGPGRRDSGGRAPRRDGAERAEGPRRGSGPRRPAGEGARPDAGGRPDGDRRDREGAGRRRSPEGAEGGPGGPPSRQRDRDRRPPVSTVHRNALLATLGPEQLPVAEQLLRGGIPAVRKAIAEHAGGPNAQGNDEAILAIAEELLPAVNLAVWKDRATAAQAEGSELRLRDLRAVVAASRTVTLDEPGRVLAKALHELQERRVSAVRTEWLRARITAAIESNRVADALRIAQRPPDPGTRLPADLAVGLTEAVSAAMTAELDTAEWTALLEIVLDSPVRRTVKPAGIPPTPEAREAARRAAGLVPALAKLLGLKIPPPPPRRSVVRRVTLTPAGGGGSAASL